MNKTPSNTTLLPPQAVAEQVGIAPKTLYAWLKSGLVQHTFDVQGRPVFTKDEAEAVARLADARKQTLERLKLPKVPA